MQEHQPIEAALPAADVQHQADSSSDDEEWEASASLLSRNYQNAAVSDPIVNIITISTAGSESGFGSGGCVAAAATSAATSAADAAAYGGAFVGDRTAARVVNETDVLMCIICWDQERAMLCLPCKHMQLCEECSKSCPNCPSCRTHVQQYLKIYT